MERGIERPRISPKFVEDVLEVEKPLATVVEER